MPPGFPSSFCTDFPTTSGPLTGWFPRLSRPGTRSWCPICEDKGRPAFLTPTPPAWRSRPPSARTWWTLLKPCESISVRCQGLTGVFEPPVSPPSCIRRWSRALSLPCGLTAAGLPIGLQLIGPWHSEAYLLGVAERLEAVLSWGLSSRGLRLDGLA